jgi:hypothetical protein
MGQNQEVIFAGKTPAGDYVPLAVDVDGQLIVSPVASPDVTQLIETSGNKANTAAVATLPGVAGKTTYITGFDASALGATAALAVEITVTDGTWSLTYTFGFPAGATVPATPLFRNFPEPLAASAPDTAISVTLPASGAGGTTASVNAYGYQE